MAKRYIYFIGVDVSKNKLDFAIMQSNKLLFHKEVKNDLIEIVPFILELKTLPKFAFCTTIFCMEHTGFYANRLIECLQKYKANTVVENSLLIKNSLGIIRGKYDKIDSIRIAQYACTNKDNLRLWEPKRAILLTLVNLFALRKRLVSTHMSLKTPLSEQSEFIKKGISKQNDILCKKTLKALSEDLVTIENTIDKILANDARLKRLMQIITSVPGVGPITAIQIIISTNEFKDINDPRKFACYAGIAPFVKESGLYKGKGKISSIANRKVKTVLHLCSMVAIRGKNNTNELRSYFDRKTLIEGKSKMSVLNAIRNKIVLRVFSCVNQDRIYETNYKKTIHENNKIM